MKSVFATMYGVEGSNGVPGVSGGDVRLIRILNVLGKSYDVVLGTTLMGQKLAEMYGYRGGFNLIRTTTASGVRANLARVWASLVALPSRRFDVAYSGGEHLYDVLPALRMKLFRRTPWLALIHWVEDFPWKDKRGGTPALHRYLYWMNRVIAMLAIRLFADHILAVSESTRDKLVDGRRFSSKRVSTVLCGLDLAFALSVRESTASKTYDAVFMKRLNLGKGVRDLIDIWSRVAMKRPGARLQIIGEGPPEVRAEIRQRIADAGLTEVVELVGVVHDPQEKLRRLASSRLFVLPSHEENWAIVIGEALAAGLPVVAYDLKEIRPLWGDRVAWVPFADVDAFADRVVALLARDEAPPLDDFLLSLDWNAIAANEERYVAELATR